ncbi:hypothetical protein P7I17_gp23 [Escherichia phage Halfdan]|uniref:Uncharacterized protein n=1 Tax=Escherichia phage Halfdan TaxID=2234092 RepID=A0A2Z5H397_9CAUD|nr:hypothetical protein P7I17_gp23 [Escherichia phage Halfdan]AXC34277.1 hypothetical protein [Escherichia phage Halfdan]
MITALLGDFGPWIVGIIGAIAGALGLYFGGKKAGKSEAETKHAEDKAAEAVAEAKATVEQVTESVKGANDVQADINRLNPGDAANKLRDEWSRD